MGNLEDVLELGQPIRAVAASDSVLEAVNEMCRWHVRAIIVGSPSDPVGIFCERDVLERIVRPGLDPARTTVGSVMSHPLVCLPSSATPDEALAYLRFHRLHQVPVLGEEALLGVVSASDLRRWALARRELDFQELASYVTLRR